MIIPTSHRCLTAQVLRDTRTGRWARRSDYLAQIEAAAQAFARGLMMAICRPLLGSRTPGTASRHMIHQELGRRHSEPALRLQTPGQVAWRERNVTPWMEV